MHLPYIQMIRLQAGQRFLQHPHGDILLAAVGADLGHHDCLIPLALERRAQALFAGALVVLPRVVEEVDSMVQGLRNHTVDFRLSSYSAEVVTTHAENRNLEPGLPHGAVRRLKLSDGSPTLSRRIGHHRIRLSLRRVALSVGGRHGDHGNSTTHSDTFQKRSTAFPAFSIGLQS